MEQVKITSVDFVKDIEELHQKFGVNTAVQKMPPEQLQEFFKFRVKCLKEEHTELETAKSADDAVDALIDYVVFALGTLDAFGVDSYLAWNRVHRANIVKERGIKPGRPNKFGLPDLCKPVGWVAPSHADNVGLLKNVKFPIDLND